MKVLSKIESSEYTDLNRVIGWFIILRWIACAGVFFTLLTVYYFFHYKLPYRVLFLLNGLLFLVNLAFTIHYSLFRSCNLSRKEMSVSFNLQVVFDYVLLFFLIFFTGFLENPFIYFFVFHIIMTAFIFSSRVVFLYVVALISVLVSAASAEYFGFIPHFPLTASGFYSYTNLIFIRTAGLCSTLIISAYLISSIKKRIEERGKKVEVELDHYKSLDRIKSDFILQVTHELRGPIAALKGFHEMVLKGITGETTKKTWDTIRKANHRTKNLLTIIDEMIDYAYIKSEEEIKFTRTRISIKDTIDYNLGLFRDTAAEKNIRFVSNCSKNLAVLSNRDLLNIILSNLISNALKYSSNDTTITVNAEKSNGKFHLMVKDEGMGIEPSKIHKIFDEFYRSSEARAIERDGTGLGLAIVKKTVESLNGKITVYSEKGRGTTFHIYFP